MELNVKERIVLRGLLPEKGDFLTFKEVRKLHEALSFSSEDVEEFGLAQADGQVTWKADKDVPREFTFNKVARGVIEKVLTDLNESGDIDEHTFGLYEKFIENDKE